MHLATENSIVLGCGIISEDCIIKCKPKQVLAVRGPLPRKILLANNIPCPNVYGDSALLLPLIYNPNITKKYKIGIIPHYIERDLEVVTKLREEKRNDIVFIKMRGYDDWHNVIDLILSCDCIISSSLHGLIISDAYGIPNVWAQFSDNIIGGEFRYKDYFGGVGRSYIPPIDYKNSIDLSLVNDVISSYKKFYFNGKKLLKNFPFAIKKKCL